MFKTLPISIHDAQIKEGDVALVRFDFNVPIESGHITDTYRIEKSLDTMRFLLAKGCKIVALSHIESGDKTLLPVYEEFKKYLSGIHSEFVKNPDILNKEKISQVNGAAVFFLENLRNFPGEKENSLETLKPIADIADLYVNEGFSVSHRKHASVSALPIYMSEKSYVGLNFMSEIENLSKVLHPERPFLFIIAGAKIETKMPLLKKFNLLADKIFVGGALANDIWRFTGKEIGQSLVSEEKIDLSDIASSKKLILPERVVVCKEDGKSAEKSLESVGKAEKIVDIGATFPLSLADAVAEAELIVWNGPMGNFEIGFDEGTKQLARLITSKKRASATTIVGGGDTLSALKKTGTLEDFSFVSTGGGAMLDFLSSETLPGLEALLA